jgi:hypothetical protein
LSDDAKVLAQLQASVKLLLVRLRNRRADFHVNFADPQSSNGEALGFFLGFVTLGESASIE